MTQAALRPSEASYLIAQAVAAWPPTLPRRNWGPVRHHHHVGDGCPCCSRPHSNRLRMEDLQMLIRSRIA